MCHARFRHVLDAELPDVRDELLALGGRRFSIAAPALAALDDATREGDERFETIAARRPIIEAAFAHVAEDSVGMKVVRGVTVEGPIADDGPRVTGVRTADGESYLADLVVDATGRRSKITDWITALGGRPPDEEAADTGFAYYTRFYEGPLPEYRGTIVTASESFYVLTIPSDNETWTIAVIAMAGDRLLKGLRRREVWERVVRAMPPIAHWIDGKPLSDVIPMAGAMDRYRRFVLDGEPIVTGLAAVGDAWACTNPTAGRGISLGLLQALALRDSLRSQGEDPAGFLREFDRITEAELTPWYRQQVERDYLRAEQVQAAVEGRPWSPPDTPVMRMQNAFAAGARKDPDLARAFLENMSVLALPKDIMARPGIFEKVMRYADADVPQFVGPDRAALASLVA
jgi:flavin-dependent dehydrogenase